MSRRLHSRDLKALPPSPKMRSRVPHVNYEDSPANTAAYERLAADIVSPEPPEHLRYEEPEGGVQ